MATFKRNRGQSSPEYADYDDVIEKISDIAESFGSSDSDFSDIPSTTRAILEDELLEFDPLGGLLITVTKMVLDLAELIRKRLDSVHGFMLKNHYRPAMIRGTCDFVVGNPPWLTLADIATPDYKKLVIDRVNESKIAPRATGEASHTELASLFFVVAADEFLKTSSKGNIAFVMPRSVMTAKHHENLRRGIYTSSFNIEEIWDLDAVSPLFRVPSCVLFGQGGTKALVKQAKNGQVFSGRLPEKDIDPTEAAKRITNLKTKFHLRFLGKRSAWVPEASKHKGATYEVAVPPYSGQFRQGAIIYPQTLFTVTTATSSSRNVATTRVKTDDRAKLYAKKAKSVVVNHIVETKNLYYTAAADQIYPYVLSNELWVVVLPTLVDPGNPDFRTVDSKSLRKNGRIHTASWLDWVEGEWASIRKEDSNESLSSRLDYAGQLSAQSNQRRYLVIYTAAGKRPVGCVLDTKGLDLPFVARDRTYWCGFKTKTEAYYLLGFLNSNFAADAIEEWMNRGLFGPRDINKRVLDVPFPKFDAKNKKHNDLAKVSETLASNAKTLLNAAAHTRLGHKRSWIRDNLDNKNMKLVEKLISEITVV